MARIAGVDIPNKQTVIALTYIYGIGRSSAAEICEKAKIDPRKMANDLTQDELAKIRELAVEKNWEYVIYYLLPNCSHCEVLKIR